VWLPMAADPASTPAGWIKRSRIVTASLHTTIKTINLNPQFRLMSNIKSKPLPSSDNASSLSEQGAKIIHYLQAGYPGLYLVSPEEQRVEAELKSVLQNLNRDRKTGDQYRLSYWSVVDGLVNTDTKQIRGANDPLEVLQVISDEPERTIFLLKDYHLFLEDPNPIILRKLKNVLLEGKTNQKTLIIIGCRLVLPPELEREITVVEFALPGKEALREVLSGIVESASLAALSPEQQEQAIDAACGLTTIEAENAFALSYVQTRTIEPSVVAREKAQAVKKSGLLEIIEARESLDSIGGLDVLKDWLLKRRNAFTQRAAAYGLPPAKGLLIIGIAGTGKSLSAKVAARIFEVPLLKLDAGRLYGGLVGQSEANLRSVIQTAEAIAPCCLWLDEVEKGLAGSKSSGSTDGGTSARVLGSLLSWMQEKTAPVFVVATANDVTQLPPELLRKGRWDEMFFVDLPNPEERQEIWRIQVAKHRRDPKDYDQVQLARATEGLTGSEIEAVFVDALYRAFDDDQEPTDLTIAEVLTDFVPLSKTMADQITGLRSWAKGRARFATSPQTERRLRMLAA
jgi:SpoVK/Ycf46/Vps4 family AAA+-type ATPase